MIEISYLNLAVLILAIVGFAGIAVWQWWEIQTLKYDSQDTYREWRREFNRATWYKWGLTYYYTQFAIAKGLPHYGPDTWEQFADDHAERLERKGKQVIDNRCPNNIPPF